MSSAGLERTAQDELLGELAGTRERTLRFAASIDAADLERQFDPLLSPLAWDLAHIAAYEDLWLVQEHAGRPALLPDLSNAYDAIATPRAIRGQIESLDAPGALEYLAAVRERTLEAAASEGVDRDLFEMVVRHEQQHMETMCQAVLLAGNACLLQGQKSLRPGFDVLLFRPHLAQTLLDLLARLLGRLPRLRCLTQFVVAVQADACGEHQHR